MKRSNFILSLIFLLIFFSGSVFSQNVYSDCWDGKIYLMYKSSEPVVKSEGKKVELNDVRLLAELANEFGIVGIEKINYFSPNDDMRRILRVTFTEFNKVDLFIKKLLSHNEIKYAEKAPIFELLTNINDANYLASVNNRWHLDKINAEAAWSVPRQINTVKIAVIDKAMDTDHPDLVNQWDTLYDICDNDNNTNPPSTVADNDPSWSHGTHTCGLAGASTNNGIGIASVAYDVKLMGIKIANDAEINIGGVTAPAGTLVCAYEAVTWAADNGADIISMSWGSARHSAIKQEIVNYAAITKHCLLIAGAGNNGTNTKFYPASLDNVMAVGGTDGDDKLSAAGMPPLYVSSGSNFGSWIDVCAPGFGMANSNDQNKVYSTAYNDSYMTIGGTSMATPIVASLAALIKSINPQLSASSIENIIKSTCVDISSLQIDANRKAGVGAGRINAEAAANAAFASINQLTPDFTANTININTGEAVYFSDLSSGTGISSWSWSFPGSLTSGSTDQNPSNIVYNTAGHFNVTLTISDGINNQSITKTAYINVKSASSMWIKQASAFQTPTRCIQNIAIVDENIAWANAFESITGSIYNEYTRTNNGGLTWISGKITSNNIPSTYEISNISPVNYNKAYICFHSMLATQAAPYGGIFVTEDGGNTWTQQASALFNNASSYPQAVHFFNANDGWCMGKPSGGYCEMYTTTDGGSNWIRVPQANIPAPLAAEYANNGMYESYNDILWWPTTKGRIYKSIDKGVHWTVVQTSLSNITGITFANENTGIIQQIARSYPSDTHVVTFNNMKTTNGGSTWTSFTPGTGIRKEFIDFAPGHPELLISAGTDGNEVESSGSSFSSDLGLTWTNIDEGVYYSWLKMFNNQIGYAGGVNISPIDGGIYKWNPIISSNESQKAEQTKEYKIYPNPTSSIINFDFYDLKNSNINISIYDITGKIVYAISENKTNGLYKKEINLQNSPKGIYFAIIKKDKDIFNEKIILQ
ncbi:MAG: S8 family serine peptidase [Bacteroidota bacterium]